MKDQMFKRATELLEADVQGELVALEPGRGLCFGFNEVATQVWRHLERPQTFGALKRALLAEYDVAEAQCETELKELLEDMCAARLIEKSA